MRIGVDATCWAHGRGYGRFVREVVTHLAPLAPEDEFICFLDPLSAERFALAAPNVRAVRVALGAAPTTAAAADGSRSPVDLLPLTHAVARTALDVFFAPTVYTYFPLPPRLPAVVGIHDTIAERFPALTLPSLRARWFWNAKVALAIWQARLVLTVSDYAAAEVQRVLGVPAGMIRVATEAPSASYRPSTPGEVAAAAARLGLPAGARWFAYVGGFSPHKHVDTLVRAHARVVRGRDEPPWLLLVGALEGDAFLGHHAAIRAAVADAGTDTLVRWTGFLPDEEVRPLLGGALALALPSAAEGFGLPAVEAAACGTPVVATVESPLPGLLDGGGLFVRPGDVHALAAALRQLLDDVDGRARMGRRALACARALSWDATARATLATLREAAA